MTNVNATEGLSHEQNKAIELLRKSEFCPECGLPENLFLLVSSLVPLPCVDLLIQNSQGQILLTRRADEYYEHSWHIPGGTMRYGDSFDRRIRETAINELNTDVTYYKNPLAVRNVIRGKNYALDNVRERGHSVAILYRCFLPDDYEIDNGELQPADNGYIKWFSKIPDDFMHIQYVYEDVLRDIGVM